MKYALITGASGGLGSLATNALVKSGFTVFATDYNINSIEENEKIIPIKMDVTDSFSIEECFNEVSKKTNHLDIIINFAGILVMNTLIEVDMNEAQRIFNINLFGTMRVNKQFFPLVLKSKGRIINIGSEVQRFTPVPFNGLYTMTKYSLDAYNDSLRRELNYLGVKVIKILPGSFKTNMHKNARSNQELLIKNTKYFKREIKSLTKMMDSELNNTNDPKYLIDAILDAVNNTNPKISYKVRNAKNQKIINLFPEKIIDNIFKKSI